MFINNSEKMETTLILIELTELKTKMSIDTIILREISQTPKRKNVMFSLSNAAGRFEFLEK